MAHTNWTGTTRDRYETLITIALTRAAAPHAFFVLGQGGAAFAIALGVPPVGPHYLIADIVAAELARVDAATV